MAILILQLLLGRRSVFIKVKRVAKDRDSLQKACRAGIGELDSTESRRQRDNKHDHHTDTALLSTPGGQLAASPGTTGTGILQRGSGSHLSIQIAFRLLERVVEDIPLGCEVDAEADQLVVLAPEAGDFGQHLLRGHGLGRYRLVAGR